MNNTARTHILANLKNANQNVSTGFPENKKIDSGFQTTPEKVARLKQLMEAVHTEVHLTTPSKLISKIESVLVQKAVKTLLYSEDTELGKSIDKTWTKGKTELPVLIPYSEEIESFREKLFEIDAAITTTLGGIADTGSLILWPTVQEPRLMSLVPPIHLAVLEADKIYADFSEAIEKTGWVSHAPGNVILISGPSKTADIELTLAYGIHGPKELVVLVVEK